MEKISKESLTLSLIGVSVIIANSWHVIAAWINKPTDTYFTGIAHYFADYFLYTSIMAQKSWIFADHLFTNERLDPTWIYWLYTILGKFGNPFAVYNVSIVLFSAVLFALWWILLGRAVTVRSARMLAFLFLATASGFAGNNFWFSPFPALNRLGGVPHQIFQSILLVGIMILFDRKRYTAVSLVSFVAATANPIQTLLLSAALVITKPPIILWLLPAAAGAMLTNLEFSTQPILTAAKAWESSQTLSVTALQCILGLGPAALLVPFGVKPFMHKPTPVLRVLGTFGALSFLVFLSPLPGLLETSAVRWLSPAAYGIVPVLAAYGLKELMQAARRIIGAHGTTVLTGTILTVYLWLTISSIGTQIESRMQSPALLQYVPSNVVRTLTSITTDGVVLIHPALPYDVLVPVFSQHKTFTGHPIHTLYPDTKAALRQKYFSGAMSQSEADEFIKNHEITSIIWR